MIGGSEWIFSYNTVNSDITLSARWIDAKSVFDFVANPDGETATLTKYKGDFSVINLPEVIGNYKISFLADELFKGMPLSDENNYIINVPASITRIGKSAFECLAGVKINIRGGLTEIGEAAFKGCDGLSEINFGEGLKQIPFESFADCVSLESLTLPATLEKIDENAFYGCRGLSYVVVRKTLKSIEDSAFEDCTSLKEIYFIGNADEFGKITVAPNGNESFISSEVFCYSETEPAVEGDFWYYDENGKIKFW